MTEKHTLSELLAEAEYMVGNPSAWDSYDETASETIRQLICALRASPADNMEGWKLVPVEPTPEMIEAMAPQIFGASLAHLGGMTPQRLYDAYVAALAASPLSPKQQGEPRIDVGDEKLIPAVYDLLWDMRQHCDDKEYVKMLLDEALEIQVAPPAPQGTDGLRPNLALIEATARKINPGRSEDHIKSVALDALSIIRALSPEAPIERAAPTERQ